MQLGDTIIEWSVEHQRANLVTDTGLAAPAQVDKADTAATADQRALPHPI